MRTSKPSECRQPGSTPSAVQCVRELRPGGGVCGVAFALERTFLKLSIGADRFTIGDLGLTRGPDKLRNLYLNKLVLLFDNIYFTLVGTLIGKFRCRGRAVICHQGVLFGGIYINHGLHRAMLEESGKKWSILLRNPVHIFTAVSDYVRFNFKIHRYIVCFAQSEADILTRYYPKTRPYIKIIPNGVDTERFQPQPVVRAAARSELGLDEYQFVLVFVGHEYERKGLYPLIESLRYLPAHIKLLVVGGVAQEISRGKAVAARNEVSERVRFLGVVHDTERIYNASDAMVLPSNMEAWPLVGLEAMSCGIPALMTAVGGIPDYLDPGKNGFFITRDPRNIAAQVITLISQPDLMQELKINARNTGICYSWDKVAEKYVTLIDRLVQKDSVDEKAIVS